MAQEVYYEREFMNTVLIVFHIFICVTLVLVVLVQAGKDGGIGMMSGGGSSQSVFGSSGGANFFTKFTSLTAAFFMVTSVFLTLSKSGHKKSVFEDVKATSSTTAPAPTPSAAPANAPATAPAPTGTPATQH